MQLTCLLPQTIEAVPITVEGIDYLAVRREDLAALFHEPTAAVVKESLTAHSTTRRKPVVKPKGEDKTPSRGKLAPRILEALPGTTTEIASRLGAEMKSVHSALHTLRERGEVSGGGRGAPWTRAKAKRSEPTAPGPQTTRDLFKEALATGPHTEAELLRYARANGKSPTESIAGEILNTMAKRGEAVFDEDGNRWKAA